MSKDKKQRNAERSNTLTQLQLERTRRHYCIIVGFLSLLLWFASLWRVWYSNNRRFSFTSTLAQYWIIAVNISGLIMNFVNEFPFPWYFPDWILHLITFLGGGLSNAVAVSIFPLKSRDSDYQLNLCYNCIFAIILECYNLMRLV